MVNREEDETPTDIVFMGGARVGKTMLLHRVLRTTTPSDPTGRYRPTVEDSYVRQFLVGDFSCQVRLVDTAGSYVFPAMQRLWVKRAAAFVLVCARDDPTSLIHLRDLLNQIREERTSHQWKRLLMVLVINKCDLHLDSWYLPDEDVEQLAEEYEIPYNSIVCTSALMQVGIDRMLRVLWQQNEDIGQKAIRYSAIKKRPPESNRRSSAFAVLFGHMSERRRSSVQSEAAAAAATNAESGDGQQSKRDSLSDPQEKTTPRFFSMTDGTPNWITRKMEAMRIGSRERTTTVDRKSKRGSMESSVIDLNCQIS